MNIKVSIPTKIALLDDNVEFAFLLKTLLSEKGFHNIYTHTNVPSLIKNIDPSCLIYIVDYHLDCQINGAQAANMIKEKVDEPEFIFISGLLSSEEYEQLINTCGCNAISRKDDFDKMLFLLRKAITAINKRILRSMEIILQGKAIIAQIDKK